MNGPSDSPSSRRRNNPGGGGGGNLSRPSLPLGASEGNNSYYQLNSHPDGSRTAPHRGGPNSQKFKNRGNSMIPYGLTASSMTFEGGGGSPTNNHRLTTWGATRGGLQAAYSSSSLGGRPSMTNGNGLLGNTGRRGGGVAPRAFGGKNSPTSPSATSLNLIRAVTGDAIAFTETNMDWTKVNIFRTRLCDRLTQTHSCHMANRCLFSHDIAWPRRTPFLPRASALTLRYIPVWCPRIRWPPLSGVCDSLGKISWSTIAEDYDPAFAHAQCIRGDNCPFVHNLEEFLYHPEVYKTRMCCLANDERIGDDVATNCAALCPWYFCPFAHYLYELRDVRGSRYAWHQPPQIVDNHFVARTQGFDDRELAIIEFVRKAPGGSLELYVSRDSPLRRLLCGRYLMAPVFRPIEGSSLERLVASDWHRDIQFDDLLYFLVVISLLNLVMYPVENFYVPTLLSLQCAAMEYQLALPSSPARNCGELLAVYDEVDTEKQWSPPYGGGADKLQWNMESSDPALAGSSHESTGRVGSPLLSSEQVSGGGMPGKVTPKKGSLSSPTSSSWRGSSEFSGEYCRSIGGPLTPAGGSSTAAQSPSHLSNVGLPRFFGGKNEPPSPAEGTSPPDTHTGFFDDPTRTDTSSADLERILDDLRPEDLLRVVELFTSNRATDTKTL